MSRIVLFDLGNVVVDWQPLRLYRNLFETEQEAQMFCRDICNLAWHTNHDRGVSMAENAKPLIEKYPQYETQIKAWHSRWLDMFVGYVPGTPEIIDELAANDVPLFGLSNIPSEVSRETFEAFPAILKLKDIVISGDEGVVKPDQRIYEIAHERMGRPPVQDVLFIDDRLDNVEAARVYGFKAHHFISSAGLKQELIEHGLLPAN